LQTLENKALSRGIIGKSAPILAEITIRKSQDPWLPAAVPGECRGREQLTWRVRLSVMLDHASNAGLASHSQGLTNLGACSGVTS